MSHGPPDPLWGIFSKTHAPLLGLPVSPPAMWIYFATGGAPHLHESPTHYEQYPPELRERLGLSRLTGVVIRHAATHPPFQRPLTLVEAHALHAAFTAANVLAGPALTLHDNKTGNFSEHTALAGFLRHAPFSVRTSGFVPYRLEGPDAPAWQRLLDLLDQLSAP